MRCYYCGAYADQERRLKNSLRPICIKADCQNEFLDDEREQEKRDIAYDEWALRSE